MKKRLLLVEDEEIILKALRRLLERNHFIVETATTVEQAIAANPQSFDLVLADIRLPGNEGSALIPLAAPVPVIIMTSYASVRSAVDAMRHGAIDYIAKPFDHDELLLLIQRALKQNLIQVQNHALRLDIQRIQRSQQHVKGTILEPMLDQLSEQCDCHSGIHLHGERGTDREGLARLIHARSNRRDAPFVVADVCLDTASTDAITLLGSDGEPSMEGLPTGGLLQAANRGTLVLRHPEKLHPELQRQLAGYLGAKDGTPSLEQSPVRDQPEAPSRATRGNIRGSTNVKLITIAHETIETLAEQGNLTAPLSSLLLNNQFAVPPLRQHREDIIPLAYQQLRALERRHGRPRMKLTNDAEAVLLAYDWPGNVTELDIVLEHAVMICHGSSITRSELGFGQAESNSHDLSLDEYFRYFVLRNQPTMSETELAARLGISRKALWERRQKMNLLK